MKVSELAKDVGDLRTEVGDLRTDVGALRTDVRDLRTEMDDKFDVLRQLIKSEGETTRGHFDVVAEKMVSGRNLALDRSMATHRFGSARSVSRES